MTTEDKTPVVEDCCVKCGQPKDLSNMLEAYANKRVIEELYEALCDNPVDMVSHLKNIIKELKTLKCK